jgi:zinc transporter 2
MVRESGVESESNNLEDSLPVSVTLSVLHTDNRSVPDECNDLMPNASSRCSGHHRESHNHSHAHAHSHSIDEEQGLDQRVMSEGKGGDVNLEAAYLHVLTDLIQSIGVAFAGLLIYLKPHWQIVDPLCTFVFSCVALYSTFPLLKKILRILLEGTPAHVSFAAFFSWLNSIHIDMID